MSDITSAGVVVDVYPFGTAAFSGLPLPPNTEFLEYSSANNWTATFSPPMTDVYLYLSVWRGAQSGQGDPPATYTFSHPFSVVTGLTGTTVGANFLVMPDSGGDFGFHSGAILFPGPISSLSVVRTGQTDSNLQSLTFATAVPEPMGMMLSCAALVVGACGRRRRAFRYHA
jgi:hypothetical protein